MRKPSCEICGSGIEPEEGAFICSSCARSRDQWLAEMARLCVIKDELIAALGPFVESLRPLTDGFREGGSQGWPLKDSQVFADVTFIEATYAAATLAKAKREIR